MRKSQIALAYLISVGCGATYIYVLSLIFGRLLIPNPINQWLIEKLVRTGREFEYYVAIYSHDFLIYVIVAMPLALVLCRLQPKNSWRYLFTAVATSWLLQYWPLIVEPSRLMTILKWAGHWKTYAGLAMSILPLPLAFAVVSRYGKCKGPTSPEAAESA